MRLRSVLIKILLVALCSGSAALPAAAADQPIYVMDMQRVIDTSIRGKAAKNSLDAEAKKREAGLAGKRADVERRREQLVKQRSLLAASALSEREEDLKRAERDLTQAAQEAREELERKRDSAMERIVKEVHEVLASLESRYPVVVERDPRLVLYASDEIDITDEVVKELDRRSVDS